MKIGVMQGRLLPKYKGRYQAHPLGYWEKEFSLAKNLGLDCIEFILDYNDFDKNPLMSDNGIKEIIRVKSKTGVDVKSICSDYFMEAPIHSENDEVSSQSIKVLNTLIKNASKLNVSDIVIPCVDKSSFQNDIQINRFVKKIKNSIKIADNNDINLALETDLSPKKFKNLLEKIKNKRVTVNYDIGNSASLGYKVENEFSAYGEKITDIHIKDRLLNGESVFLGEGDADFDDFFSQLSKQNFDGLIIFQAFRDNDGVEIFKKQYNWIKKKYL